jgi:hydroxybutyrate-dimer hydrolase
MLRTILAGFVLLGCSNSVSVTISPTTATVAARATQQFAATVGNASDQTVTWSVQEASGGAVDANGLYTAPTVTGTYHVIATSKADPTRSATATVTVVPALNSAPPSMVAASMLHVSYDGTTNDLLTAGLGKSGLQGAAPTQGSLTPAAFLRRLAIYNNYRALVDMSTAGGYGVLYGPNIDTTGNDTLGQGMIAGDEYLAFADDGTGTLNVTMMVQIPASFDLNNPCIVTGTSSGSRGVYGAIATAGEWGLKHKCAVAYSDKGTGNGWFDMQNGAGDDINGIASNNLGATLEFFPNLSAADFSAFKTATPNRFAYKHAHSQKNPEKDWGKNALDAILFAFFELNEKLGPVDTATSKHQVVVFPGSTIVIAASVSNGGGASLAAAEQDTQGLISGVVAGEPQVQLAPSALAGLTIKRGANAVTAFGKPLYDYFTVAELYQPCAALSASANSYTSPVGAFQLNNARATARCASLNTLGYLTSTTTASQADEALAKLRAAGWEVDSDPIQLSHYTTNAVPAVTVTYANTYSRSSVKDNLCGFSFGATDGSGASVAAPPAAVNNLFGNGNGVPPTGPLSLIQNNSQGAPIREDLTVSAGSGTADYDADGADCLRKLFTGTTDPKATAVKTGIGEVQRTGNLRGKPAILVQGRADTLVPINHASRAYYGANQLAEGSASKVRLYEVTRAQHFDSFIPAFPGMQQNIIPLHRYVINSLDIMYAYLKSGTALPASQVVRTTPRGGPPTPAIAALNVPPITAPAAGDTITFSSGTLTVPE